jgi:hypothetical protein
VVEACACRNPKKGLLLRLFLNGSDQRPIKQEVDRKTHLVLQNARKEKNNNGKVARAKGTRQRVLIARAAVLEKLFTAETRGDSLKNLLTLTATRLRNNRSKHFLFPTKLREKSKVPLRASGLSQRRLEKLVGT